MVLTRTLVTRGFGGISTPAGPATPTLSIADNGNDTGATATIASGSVGAANVVYTKSADANLSGSWTSSGSRSGDGTVSLSLAAGRYWGYLESTLNSQEVATAPIFFAVTTGADAVLKQILDAVRSRIVTLALSGIADASILVRKVNTHKGIGTQEASPAIAWPAIIIAPASSETMPSTAGTNERDDIGYPIMVGMVDADEQALTENHNRNLLWRQQIRQAFISQRLAGVTEVNACAVEPRDITKFADWVTGKYVSLLVLRFTSRETRGV